MIETSSGVALVRRRILVVDDYADARELYASFFVDAGFQVAEAENGEVALEAIAISRPDCIIMDLAMPVMDGWAAIDRIRNEPSTADILIIILSGHASVDDHRRARTVGVVNVLTKPCLPAALLERVRCLLL